MIEEEQLRQSKIEIQLAEEIQSTTVKVENSLPADVREEIQNPVTVMEPENTINEDVVYKGGLFDSDTEWEP